MARKLIRKLAVAASLCALAGGCASTTTKTGAKPSFTESITTSVKSGANKVTAALTPKPSPPEETSGFKDPKPTPSLYLAVGQLAERSGKLEEAETNYRKALALDSSYLPAMLGLAHLEDGRKNFDAADALYHRAVKKHPKEAMAHNDLGLCYHRQGKLKEAAKSLQTAVELQPSKHLYRDNLAAVLVEQGRNEEALKQLCSAHGDAVGHYNLAYLLAQRPDPRPSLPYFQLALEKDPNLTPAREWIAQLAPQAMVPRQPMPAPPQGWVPPGQPQIMTAQQARPQQAPPQQAPPIQAPPQQAPMIVSQQQLPPSQSPPAQAPVIVARQTPPAAQAAIPPSEPLPSINPPAVAQTPATAPASAPAATEPTLEPEREPAIVAQAERPARQPQPAVETLRSEGTIRATVGEGANNGAQDFQFVPSR